MMTRYAHYILIFTEGPLLRRLVWVKSNEYVLPPDIFNEETMPPPRQQGRRLSARNKCLLILFHLARLNSNT